MYRVREYVKQIVYGYEVVTETGALVTEVGSKVKLGLPNAKIVGPTMRTQEDAERFAKELMS